ncbi:MAG TPA: hypothetical protein VGQ51_13170 [Puia sp.]|nr:hypothetical protein [Puia sp.]
MKTPGAPVTLGRCLLAGLLTGIVAAVIVSIFNIIYRRETELIAYAVVMHLSIFMAFPFFHLVSGGFYYLFIDHLKKGTLIFVVIMLLGTVISALITAYAGNRSDPTVEAFRGLLIGLEIIGGLLGAFLIPYLVRHPTLFLTAEDIKGEE